MRALKMLLHLARMHKIPSRSFLRIPKYISLPRNIMGNFISTGNKRICFDSSWESVREKQQLLLSTRPFGWGDRRPTNQRRLRLRRARYRRARRRRAPGFFSGREGRTWKPSSTANRVACIPDIFLPNWEVRSRECLWLALLKIRVYRL